MTSAMVNYQKIRRQELQEEDDAALLRSECAADHPRNRETAKTALEALKKSHKGAI